MCLCLPWSAGICVELGTSLGRVGLAPRGVRDVSVNLRSVWEGLYGKASSGLSLCVPVVLQSSFCFLRNEIFSLSDAAGITHPNPPQTIHFLLTLGSALSAAAGQHPKACNAPSVLVYKE